MSSSGLCQICESATATHDCDRCGTLVCDEHYHRQTGYCTNCARELGRGAADSSTDRGVDSGGADSGGTDPGGAGGDRTLE